MVGLSESSHVTSMLRSRMHRDCSVSPCHRCHHDSCHVNATPVCTSFLTSLCKAKGWPGRTEPRCVRQELSFLFLLKQFSCFFFFWPHHAACGILVPDQESNLCPLHWMSFLLPTPLLLHPGQDLPRGAVGQELPEARLCLKLFRLWCFLVSSSSWVSGPPHLRKACCC